jgi:hypothetical protein
LRGLQILINTEEHVRFASLWIMTCIILHIFAMKQEEGMDMSRDVFLEEGLAVIRTEQAQRATQGEQEEHAAHSDDAQDVNLLEGRLKREELKKHLFAFLDA